MIKKQDLPYVICEMANVHGGDRDKLFELVNAYMAFDYQNKAIKFQVLKADQLALPDYQWFPVYKELFFEPHVWHDVITQASIAGDVWLDLFDVYGVEILEANKSYIAGLKLQASVLDNIELINAISKVGVESKSLMINISGYEVSEIEKYVAEFQRLGFSNLILQIGYQSYPTSISDTGLQKISVLKAAFPGIPLCIADHAPGEIPVARQIPAWAIASGCSYVEKHFCIDRRAAKYDHFSALEPKEFVEMLQNLSDCWGASSGNFISDAEEAYLRNSYQAPLAREQVPAGGMLALNDLLFRRTSQKGLTLSEIMNEQGQFHVLENPIQKNSTISKKDFRRARIGAIVACRMKSARLKKKALLPIHGVPAVERCLQNCLNMPNIDEVVLATSVLEEDGVLQNHLLEGRVKFWQGNPEDVIQRYLGACDKYSIDVIVRVTADCPAISPEITDFLLKSHFEAGADYTAANNCAVGSSPEIYNVEALRRTIELLGSADHSEYMTWYMRNNADIFKVNVVDLPSQFQRDYRLTLDYKEDLEMFDRLYSTLDEKKLAPSIANVFLVLDQDASISQMNQHLTLAYKTDAELINRLNKVTRIVLPKD